MYNALFGLSKDPFSIAPDPRFLYMSERHREALAHLLYGAQGGGGLVLLTGAVGAGKTTVCRAFVEQLPKSVDLAYVFNPALSVPELLATVSDDFGLQVPAGASVKAHVDVLNEFLLLRHAEGRSCVLVIDEAQNLAPEVLEQLRMLTNLETDTRKLLQIILIGQPELRDRLADPSMEQVAQRVVARYHLEPLDAADTRLYVRHRMAVAGLVSALPFDEGALARVHRHSRGVPRRINLLCDRALLGAYARQRTTVDAAMVDQAAREVFDDRPGPPSPALAAPSRRSGAVVASALLAGLVAVAGAAAWWSTRSGPPHTAAADATAALPSAPAPASAVPAAAPAAAQTPEPLVDAAALVARIGFPNEDAAWRALAALWGDGVDVSAGQGGTCDRLGALALACHRGSGSLALLRQIDRPVWVSLQLAGAGAVPVLLTGLGEREARLRLPDGTVRVSVATLAARWTGDFGTLWRRPPGLSPDSRLSPGTPAFEWVAERLKAEQAGALPADSPMPVRIQAFQRSQGLAVDGLAGPLTLMQINRAAAVDEPRLTREP